MDLDELAVWIEALGTIGLLVTLLLILNQIRIQKRDLEHRIYQQVSDRYSDLLWRAAEDPRLDLVWQPLTADERAWFDAQRTSDGRWTTWGILSSSAPGCPFDLELERRLYRYTRASLELCEQVFLARISGAVTERVWLKYAAVLSTWISARWFSEVFRENRARFDAGFAKAVDDIVASNASG